MLAHFGLTNPVFDFQETLNGIENLVEAPGIES